MQNKTEQLKKIRDEVWNLKESPLYKYRMENKYYCVIGEGDHDSDILFIGEAPGKNEAKTGRPFCGAAGRILDELLAHINLPREEVYITNILKDRPPGNRDPSSEEIALYAPFLDRQIEIIKPKVIATLGRFSMQYVMERYGLEEKVEAISKIHGHVFKTEVNGVEVVVVPLYHPAVAVYNPNQKDELKKDFEVLKKYAAQL